MTAIESETIVSIVWILGTIIGCAITWYKSAVLLAKGQDSYYVSEKSIIGYLLSILWPYALIGTLVFLPFIGLGKLSDHLRDKLVKRLKAR